MDCNYTVNLRNREYLFKSEMDVNKFLYDNRERLKLDDSDFLRC